MPKTSRRWHIAFLRTGLLLLVVALPFYLFFVVWLVQVTPVSIALFSAWKEVLVLALAIITLLIFKIEILRLIWRDKLLLLMATYLCLSFVYLILAGGSYQAIVGTVVNTRFLLIFGVAYFAVKVLPDLTGVITKIILITATVVAVLGIMQASVLPRDILTHVGYERPGQSLLGIPPAFHRVGSSGLIRAQGTLRGPNALGAYMILPLSLAVASVLRHKKDRAIEIGVVLLSGFALLFSYSRSAWLGATGSLVWIVGWCIRGKRVIWLMGLVIMIAAISLVLALKNTVIVRQTILHDDAGAAQSSNAGHQQATIQAVKAVANNPLGGGPGRAGPVSALGDSGAVIAENYFLQIGQELGWLGLGLLITIHGLLFARFLKYRHDWLALPLAGALIGLVFTNLLQHTWADETVALTWWMLAGLIVGRNAMKTRELRSKTS